ncbi:MAG: FAD-dependent oxidoreductase [Deltaproteobacteria bacterium]|jgi:NADPH-dependent 2,4-dienoyl-CoA reductase/sulfur reductase-like enzyme/rhodanese-related sulfurtransferase|nr:FAD-dependent oxidoreductase [Deltaproteobacteria bacterium]
MTKIIIVGGVAGGATAATRLRRLDERAEIILFEKGEHISFANCGLPYYIGEAIDDRAKLLTQKPQNLRDRYNLDVRVNNEVLAINREAKMVLARDLLSGREYSESYDKIILAPGASPFVPPMKGVSSAGVFTLRTVPDADRIKEFVKANNSKTATIVGAGFIGLELAENLSLLGLTVNVLQRADRVLPILDPEMVPTIHACLRQHGVNLFLRNSVAEITQASGRLELKLEDQTTLLTDILVLAVGVRPDSLIAKNAGLKINARGGIIVDQNQRTSDENIYAVGDAIETLDYLTKNPAMLPLAAPAQKQARVAADHICGLKSQYAGALGTSILKIFEMTVGLTGHNEEAVDALGLDYDKAYLLATNYATYYPEASPMWLKVLFEKKTARLLGAQIVGHAGVDKRLDVLSVALKANLPANALGGLDLAYAPPYSMAKDPINQVGLMIENLLTGFVQQFHWTEVDKLPQDGTAILLDVRGEDEFAKGHLPGFQNLPLKKLRSELGQLDPAKPVYINCEAGLRSYVAARILKQNSFKAFYLSGGYRLYAQIKNDQ